MSHKRPQSSSEEAAELKKVRFDPVSLGLPAEFQLTDYTRLKGCSCKLPQPKLLALLQEVSTMPGQKDVGMDCSIVPLHHTNSKGESLFLVSTTDFFFPSVSDPFLQGQIGAANVLSDLYSMGISECDTMLMLLAASTDMDENERLITTREIMKGFSERAQLAATTVTGGQTVMNPWPLIGGVAMAVVSEAEMVPPSGLMRCGDILVLTKPLGCQIAVNLKQWLLRPSPLYEEAIAGHITPDEIEELYNKATDSMRRLNREGARLMRKHGAHGATDVTGFGILGHANNFGAAQSVGDSPCSVCLVLERLPIFKTAVVASKRINDKYRLLEGYSAETSGGLLVALPSVSVAKAFCAELTEVDGGCPSWIVGHVENRTDNAADSVYARLKDGYEIIEKLTHALRAKSATPSQSLTHTLSEPRMQRYGLVGARCISASVSQRRSSAESGASSVWHPLCVAKREFNIPNIADLLTSPAGLMALLQGRTGNQLGSPSPSTSSLPGNGDANAGHHRRKMRGRRQRQLLQLGSSSNEGASSEEGVGGENRWTGTRRTLLGNREVIILAGAFFTLSALWDLFTSQKSAMWQFVKNSVATTLEVRSSSQEFAMIVDWMGRQPHGQHIRNLSLKPVTVQDEQKMMWRDVPSSLSDNTTESGEGDTDARVTLVPGYGSHLFRFGSTWVHITRSEDLSKQKAAATNRVDRENDKLILTFLTRRQAVVQQFIAHVHESWRENVRNTVYIYLSEGYGPRWRPLSERIRRPLSTLHLPADIKAVVDEARLFFQLKDTYTALGIPWRRGYLLEGPPGTGKTSFVIALAGELGLPVHILSLRSDNMDDDALLSLASSVPRRSILLIEDIENVLKTQLGAGPQAGGVTARGTCGDQVVEAPCASPALLYSTDIGGGPRSAMSLSALLNALDGVSSSEGRLLLITANNTSNIPFSEVLLRPGRIDRRITFEPLQAERVLEMEASFQKGLQARPSSITGNLKLPDTCLSTHKSDRDAPATLTPAECQQRLLNAVYTSLVPRPLEKSE